MMKNVQSIFKSINKKQKDELADVESDDSACINQDDIKKLQAQIITSKSKLNFSRTKKIGIKRGELKEQDKIHSFIGRKEAM